MFAAAVTATDYVPELLTGASARALANGLHITCQEADAEALPFDDDAFVEDAVPGDVVVLAIQGRRQREPGLRVLLGETDRPVLYHLEARGRLELG